MSIKDKTVKEKALAMIQRLGDDVTYDDVIYHLEFMKAVEQGIDQADRGMGIDDEDFWAQLEAEDAAEKAAVDANGSRRSARNPTVHRGARVTQERTKVRAKDKGSR